MNEIELEFTKLVREYRKTIYTVCYFFSDNPTEVEDLFQEGLCQVPWRQQSQDVDLACQPEHLLQHRSWQEAACTNRSADYRQRCDK